MAPDVEPDVLEDLLEEGLDDWVPLISVASALTRHLQVEQDRVCAPMASAVRSLVDSGTFRAGTLNQDRGFAALDEPLDDLLRRVCDEWRVAEQGDWWWACWLELTDQGRALVRTSLPHLVAE
jgi:hypothetical protein